MGLAGAARAESNDILAPINPFAAGEFQDLHLVQCGDCLEVKAVEAFDGRELRGFDPALDHAPFAINHLQLDQPGEELNVIQPLGRGLPCQLAVFAQDCRQTQHLEVMIQKDFGGLGHVAAPCIRDM